MAEEVRLLDDYSIRIQSSSKIGHNLNEFEAIS